MTLSLKFIRQIGDDDLVCQFSGQYNLPGVCGWFSFYPDNLLPCTEMEDHAIGTEVQLMKRFFAHCNVGTMEILMELEGDFSLSVDRVRPPFAYPRVLRL